YVQKKVPLNKLRADHAVPPALPASVGGRQAISTDVKVIGKVCPELNITRCPVQPGYSIGHVKSPGGTLGAFVKKGRKLLMLSNSHVLAYNGRGKRGDDIIYPCKFDGGAKPADLVGKLEDFVQFRAGGDFVNRVDCAIAEPLESRLEDIKKEIKRLGLPKGTVKPRRGMKIMKFGRTTSKTTGTILDVHFRTTVNYQGVGAVGFVNQVLCTRYTEGGDSGSLVIDKETGKAVGLHFSGAAAEDGNQGGSIFNPIDEVLKALGVKLVTEK
ncbi:MAG TPA: hypothetical protein VJT09_04315, partial [Pyrinomonadaceae bacterium]|nr:hypothetical protein [Pyrinomonadaceae bacterium]